MTQDPQYAIVQTMPRELDLTQSAVDFAADWNFAVRSAEERRRLEWYKLILAWLDAKESRSGSRHTRRNYEGAVKRWMEFVGQQRGGAGEPLQLWEVDSGHVRSYQRHLVDRGASDNYCNHQLSCISSLYSFVINEKMMIDGVELDMFVDAAGHTRANPFKVGNIVRSRVDEYATANPLTLREFDQLMTHLEEHQHTINGARNYALIASYLYTGWRSAELRRMRWGDIRESRTQPGTYIYKWTGKGGKKKDDTLPAVCYHAITHYLKLAGRWLPGQEAGRHADNSAGLVAEHAIRPEEHVWLPVSTHSLENFANIGEDRDADQPISGKTALRILRSALRWSGVPDWNAYRIHDLRHTHARLLLESGHDINVVRERLNHANLGTTGRYTAIVHKADPVDHHSAGFMQLRANL